MTDAWMMWIGMLMVACISVETAALIVDPVSCQHAAAALLSGSASGCFLSVRSTAPAVECLVSRNAYGETMLSVKGPLSDGEAAGDGPVTTNISLQCRSPVVAVTPWSWELGNFMNRLKNNVRLEVTDASLGSVYIGAAGQSMNLSAVDVVLRNVVLVGSVVLADFDGFVERLSILMADHCVYRPAATMVAGIQGLLSAVSVDGSAAYVNVSIQNTKLDVSSDAVRSLNISGTADLLVAGIRCDAGIGGPVHVSVHNVSIVFNFTARYASLLLQRGVTTSFVLIRAHGDSSEGRLLQGDVRISATNVQVASCLASGNVQMVDVSTLRSSALSSHRVMIELDNVTVRNTTLWPMPAVRASLYRTGFIAVSIADSEHVVVNVSRVSMGAADDPIVTASVGAAVDELAPSSAAYGYATNVGLYLTMVNVAQANHASVFISGSQMYAVLRPELVAAVGISQLIRSMTVYGLDASNVIISAKNVTMSIEHVGPLCAAASRSVMRSLITTQGTMMGVAVGVVALLGEVDNTTVTIEAAAISSTVGSMECTRASWPATIRYSETGVEASLPNILPRSFLSMTAFSSGQVPSTTNVLQFFETPPPASIQLLFDGALQAVNDACTFTHVTVQLVDVVFGKRFQNAVINDMLNVTKASPTPSGGSGTAFPTDGVSSFISGHVFLLNTVVTTRCDIVMVAPGWRTDTSRTQTLPIPPLFSAVNVSLWQHATLGLTADGANASYRSDGTVVIGTALQYAVVLQNISGVAGDLFSQSVLRVTLQKWRRFPALSQSFIAVDGVALPADSQITLDDVHFDTTPGVALGSRSANAVVELPPRAVDALRGPLRVSLRCVTRDGIPPPLRRIVWPPTSALVRQAITYATQNASCAVPLPLWTETAGIPVAATEPEQQQVVVPRGVEVGVVGGSLTVPTPSASNVGLLQQNIRLLQQAIRCSHHSDNNGEDGGSDFMTSPLDNPLGWAYDLPSGSSNMRFAVGAVAGNVMLVAGVGLLLYLGHVAVLAQQRAHVGRSWRWVLREGSLRAGGVVTSYMIGYMTLLQPVIAASVALLIRAANAAANDNSDNLGGDVAERQRKTVTVSMAAGVCGCVFAMVPVTAWTVRVLGTWRWGSTMPLRLKRPLPLDNGSDERTVAELRFGRVTLVTPLLLLLLHVRRIVERGLHVLEGGKATLEWTFLSQRENRERREGATWGLVRAAALHPRLYVPVVEPYASLRVWFFAVDFGLNAVAAGVIGGIAEGTQDCGWTLWAALGVTCVSAAAVVLLRPHRSRVDGVLTAAGALSAFSSATAAIVAPDAEVASKLLWVQASLSFLPVVVGALRAIVGVISLLLLRQPDTDGPEQPTAMEVKVDVCEAPAPTSSKCIRAPRAGRVRRTVSIMDRRRSTDILWRRITRNTMTPAAALSAIVALVCQQQQQLQQEQEQQQSLAEFLFESAPTAKHGAVAPIYALS